MKYVIDKKNNTEKVYSMCFVCEACMNDDTELAPKQFCIGCPDFTKSNLTYKEIYSGKIGMSFLEFISNDFRKITEELIELFYEFQDKNIDEAFDALDKYLETQHYYIKLMGIQGTFDYLLNPRYNKPDFATPESEIGSAFNEIITIQKIISAYADDKYFVEPTVLLQAIDEYQLMFCPSVYVPDVKDNYKDFQKNPVEAIKNFAEKCAARRGNTYEFPTFHQMFGVAFDWIVNNNYKISRCENCGKFFVPYGRYDTRYCLYPFKNGKSCRELSFAINIDNNKVMKEYRKIYKTKHAWTNRNKGNRPGIENDFAKWHKAAKSMVDKYKVGAVSEMECLKWLEENK